MALKLNKLSYEEIKVGDTFSFERTITAADIKKFAELAGDQSPLHVDEKYGQQTQFGGNIAHGMLLGSLFSTLVGMLCPGERALYLSQTLNFRKPVMPGTNVVVEGRVISKSDVTRSIEIETKIKNPAGETIVDGLAKVRVRA